MFYAWQRHAQLSSSICQIFLVDRLEWKKNSVHIESSFDADQFFVERFIYRHFSIICYFLIVNHGEWKWKFHFAINAFHVESPARDIVLMSHNTCDVEVKWLI